MRSVSGTADDRARRLNRSDGSGSPTSSRPNATHAALGDADQLRPVHRQPLRQAGVWALLVGDSAANNVYGYETTLPVTVDELLPLVRAVVKSTKRAFVVGDLPFGSYEDGPSQALETAIRFMKEGGCHAVKFEGGVRVAEQIRKVTDAGIPVMGHIGFTPQSEHQLGGYRVQGRGDERAAPAGRRSRRGRRGGVRGGAGDGARATSRGR